ncbi:MULTISPECIES: 50S ribosomal protein L22 [Staphylococcaceae]|uniref:Large ribosomal subunit protein uL22 n=2 Tax=Staphylococcaceae TaxID=90964 RepID=A0A4R6C4V3_9STAP|nr:MULTISPECIES: 50S ribosomal protein L22 [Macrococcus]MCO4095904.1 50S ribosomal protein L22 [Macrococcus canis]MDJ1112173.1 50S ribosomal protein L22 [Macrococcus sp. S115]MEE1107249.1 50S ribosomal protein L22 [Macrococcus canis]QCT73930.1 50S ribosomal protein L22 [Macrococcus canis]QIH74962.1 50S ribosomal protein L22 [Macrococcus canis]
MEAKAVARTIRIAPRKVRLVLDLIRGKEVAEAIAILKLTNKASSPVVEKLLMSALANAEHNYDMNIDTLVVKEAYANEGPTLKRFRPRAQGRASAINKRTSHITIVVADKEVKTSNTEAQEEAK